MKELLISSNYLQIELKRYVITVNSILTSFFPWGQVETHNKINNNKSFDNDNNNNNNDNNNNINNNNQNHTYDDDDDDIAAIHGDVQSKKKRIKIT